MLRGLLTIVTFVVATTVLGLTGIVAGGITGRTEIVFRLGQLWSRLILGAAGVAPIYSGLEHAGGKTPRVFLANHLSALDIWVLAVILPDTTRFVSKRSVFWIPVLGQAMKVAGFIPIDRKDKTRAIRSLAGATAAIRGGASVILFPEGTRSRDGKLAPFKKGSFHLALAAGVPIVPIAISGTGTILRPRSIVIRRGTARVTVLPPLDPASFGERGVEALAREVRARIAGCLAPEELADADRAPQNIV
ncbi:MAG TPA: lysophospholipid acyltransferase family protein [Candidatus Sulfotelmatobacter sp.]|jgi:1-acyl-sn-glycerol-3-phosphate acyltransferase|nr:lysophospholipid acyltransferase family protein [Candidatus Sulfotelmatobacter sp.]